MAEAIREMEREEQAMEGRTSEDRGMRQAEEIGLGPQATGRADEAEEMQPRAAETAEDQARDQMQPNDGGMQQPDLEGGQSTGQLPVVNA